MAVAESCKWGRLEAVQGILQDGKLAKSQFTSFPTQQKIQLTAQLAKN